MQPARKRGASTRGNGSTAIICMLASCSVARISPISAVSAEPARPAYSSAVSTGPSSRIRGQRHHRAQRGGRAEIHQVGVSLQAQHHADEQAGDQDDGQRQHADRVQLLDQQTGAAEQKRQRAQQLQQEQDWPGPAEPTDPVRSAPIPPATPSCRSARQQIGFVRRRRIMKGHRTVGQGVHELIHQGEAGGSGSCGVPCSTT